MFNYKNLCDYEFEILCKDIMQKKLGVPLQIFARGRVLLYFRTSTDKGH